MKLDIYLSQNGISRSDFATKIGVSEVAITRYIGSKRFPRREHLEAISRETNGAVSANDFLEGAGLSAASHSAPAETLGDAA